MCDTSLSVSDACPCPIHVQDGYGGSGEVSVLPRLAVLDLLICMLKTIYDTPVPVTLLWQIWLY